MFSRSASGLSRSGLMVVVWPTYSRYSHIPRGRIPNGSTCDKGRKRKVAPRPMSFGKRARVSGAGARRAQRKDREDREKMGFAKMMKFLPFDLFKKEFKTRIREYQIIIVQGEMTSGKTMMIVMMIEVGHDRNIKTDIALGLAKRIVRLRSNLKLIISITELNADKFSEFFDGAPIFRVPEQCHPVDIFNAEEPELDYFEACINLVLRIHTEKPSGDILVFLTDKAEIERCQNILQERVHRLGPEVEKLLIICLYEKLPYDMLTKIFQPTPTNTRKVVLATNIAETLPSIDNIVYVIDSGLEEQNYLNSRTGSEMLMNVSISKASAMHRAGLAGHVACGKCIQLYKDETYEGDLEENTVPEIMRSNLSHAMLMLKALGINDLLHFDFLDPPPRETLVFALEQLYALGALNHRFELTKTGRRMAVLPVDPMMAKMLLASEKYKCSEEVVTIVAMLLVHDTVFYRPNDNITDADNARKNFNHPDGDHLSLMQVYNQWTASGYSKHWCSKKYIKYHSMKRAREIRLQLVEQLHRANIVLESSLTDSTNILKAIITGYFYHVAHHTVGRNYRPVKDVEPLAMQYNSALIEKLPTFVLYHELVFTTKAFMRVAIAINSKLLHEVVPHFFKTKVLK